MSCEPFVEARILAAYGEAAGSGWDAHLAGCASCAAEVDFVQLDRAEEWFTAEVQGRVPKPTPVDADYQVKRLGHRPVARHGWGFDIPL